MKEGSTLCDVVWQGRRQVQEMLFNPPMWHRCSMQMSPIVSEAAAQLDGFGMVCNIVSETGRCQRWHGPLYIADTRGSTTYLPQHVVVV